LRIAFENRAVQVGRARFACVEFNDYPFVQKVDDDILDAINSHQHRTPFTEAFIAIFTFGGDFDRFD
jgi:hypothetical protein